MEEAAEAASAVRKGKPGVYRSFCLRRSERGRGAATGGGRGDPVLHYGDPLPLTPSRRSLGQFLEEPFSDQCAPSGSEASDSSESQTCQ